jgi:nitroimidazol reductase NimA-like FMN-containing flavoprotein (pyridoxamine 5'-phosphate oxidase superfamily)
MISFTKNEKDFLNDMEECRVATSHNDIPHVKPVSFIFDNESFLIATDYETRMYQNLLKNPKMALVIDVYKHGSHTAVCVQGKAEIIENGEEFIRIFKQFHEKFEWVRKEPWKENEAPFVRLIPSNKTSWGLE